MNQVRTSCSYAWHKQINAPFLHTDQDTVKEEEKRVFEDERGSSVGEAASKSKTQQRKANDEIFMRERHTQCSSAYVCACVSEKKSTIFIRGLSVEAAYQTSFFFCSISYSLLISIYKSVHTRSYRNTFA